MVECVCASDLYTCDIISCTQHDGLLYTGGDDGVVKVWNSNLGLEGTWKAHNQVVFDLTINPGTGDVYTCSLDGEIKQWRFSSKTKTSQLIKTAIQTGPSGKGQDLPGLGGVGSLEDTPANVRKLVWQGDHLYSGDEMGSICRWTSELKLEMKKEYLTEIWSMHVDEKETLIYSGRDNDIVLASLPQRASLEDCCVQVSGCIPGRCPVVANQQNSLIVLVNRNGLHIDIWKVHDGKTVKHQTLVDHDMIVNCIMLTSQEKIITAGWDAKVNVWVKNGSEHFILSSSTEVDSYINCMCLLDEKHIYVCGKSGYIAKIKF